MLSSYFIIKATGLRSTIAARATSGYFSCLYLQHTVEYFKEDIPPIELSLLSFGATSTSKGLHNSGLVRNS